MLVLANNGIHDASPLGFLPSIETLDLSRNRLEGLDSVQSMLTGAARLRELDLRGNPISSGAGARQAFDVIVVTGRQLELLNAREIRPEDRPFLTQLQQRRDGGPPRLTPTHADAA